MNFRTLLTAASVVSLISAQAQAQDALQNEQSVYYGISEYDRSSIQLKLTFPLGGSTSPDHPMDKSRLSLIYTPDDRFNYAYDRPGFARDMSFGFTFDGDFYIGVSDTPITYLSLNDRMYAEGDEESGSNGGRTWSLILGGAVVTVGALAVLYNEAEDEINDCVGDIINDSPGGCADYDNS
ncbi:MAG: hypothetical protein CMK07_04010 [Ponticaulis sp.]|nr:hypothetical protein [Ponticaulis sp.]